MRPRWRLGLGSRCRRLDGWGGPASRAGQAHSTQTKRSRKPRLVRGGAEDMARKKQPAGKKAKHITRKGTYAGAGVNLDEADRFVERLMKRHPALGGFSGAFPIDVAGMKNPVLMASTDGVGTKLLLARSCEALGTIGIDLVAMVANDIAVTGARPLFFLDYYATGKLSASEGAVILSGIEKGCEKARMELIGGETAELPGLYEPDEFDLAGFGVGLVEKDAVVDGSDVREGDVVLGVASSGVHSNGFSLVRAVIRSAKLSLDRQYDEFDAPLGEILMRPTRIYVKSIRALLDAVPVHAMAHITGGGIPGNLERVIPEGMSAVIDAASWEPPPVFKFIEERGQVPHAEMMRVFNMGVGLVAIVREKHVRKATKALLDSGGRVWKLGHVEKGKLRVVIHGQK